MEQYYHAVMARKGGLTAWIVDMDAPVERTMQEAAPPPWMHQSPVTSHQSPSADLAALAAKFDALDQT